MSRHLLFWKSLGANKFIIDTIENGYVVPFTEIPPPMNIKNNTSAIKNEHFVDQSISDLLESGCVQEVPFHPWVVTVILRKKEYCKPNTTENMTSDILNKTNATIKQNGCSISCDKFSP